MKNRTLTQRALDVMAAGTYMSGEECLAYLKQPQNFNNLSTQLRRLMRDMGLGETDEQLTRALLERIDRQEITNANKKKYLRANAKKWISDGKGIERESAIILCLALQLDEEQARDFLRKGCNEPFFNFRSAEEVVYFYCLLNKLTYKKARQLVERYDSDKRPVSEMQAPAATLALKNAFAEWSFDDEEAFLDALCQNKRNFVCYSNMILCNYRSLRNSLSLKIIDKCFDEYSALEVETSHEVAEQYRGKSGRMVKRDGETRLECEACGKVSYITIGDGLECDWRCVHCGAVKYAKRELTTRVRLFLEALAKCDAEFAKHYTVFRTQDRPLGWKRAYKRLCGKIDQIQISFADIAQNMDGNLWVQAEFEAMGDKPLDIDTLLAVLVSDRQLYREMMGGVPFAQRYGKSALGGNMLQHAPRSKYLSDLRNENKVKALAVPSQMNHKIIVLFFFVDYLLGWLSADDPAGYGYSDFCARLSALLDECGLPFLYPGDPYDWFVLNTIRSVEENGPDEGEPLAFFNEVIRLSFEDDEA